MLVNTTDITAELMAAWADVQAISTAITVAEGRLARARQAAGALRSEYDRLSAQLVAAQAVANSQASTNAAADAALAEYHRVLPRLQELVPKLGRADGEVAQIGKQLEHLEELRRRATERAAELEQAR